MIRARATSLSRAVLCGGLVAAAAVAATCGSSGDGGISCAADDVCQPRCAHDPDCAGGGGSGGSTGDGAADRGPDGQTDARSAVYPQCADDNGCPVGEFCYRSDLKCRPLAPWGACPRAPLACPAGDAGAGSCLLSLLGSTPPYSYGDLCAPGCGDGGPCPAAPGGTAVASCSAAASACVLDCSGGRTCPTGMTCSPVDSHCAWPEPSQ